MNKQEAQDNFDEKRKILLKKLQSKSWGKQELDELLKELEGMKEMKDLEKALDNLNKAKNDG